MADDFKTRAFNHFVKKGWAPHQAAALAGQAQWESGGSSTIEDPRGEGSRGLFQWRLGRRTGLNDFAKARGLNPDKEDTQLDYADWELNNTEKPWGEKLRGSKDVGEATNAVISFLRPQGWTPDNPTGGHGYSNRYNLAAGLVNASPMTTVLASPPPQHIGAGAASNPAMAQADTSENDRLLQVGSNAAQAAVNAQPAAGAPAGLAGAGSLLSSLNGLTRTGQALSASAEPKAAQMAPLAPSPVYRPDMQKASLLDAVFGSRRNSLFG